MADKRADVMKRMLLEAQKAFGADSCYVVPDHAKTHYGAPVDNLALQYLLCSTVLPLERIVELSGPFGSGKSALGYELVRMVVAANGLGSIIETENKSSATLMQSILGEELAPLVRTHRARSMEDGQSRITQELKMYQKACPDKSLPMALLLDSLVGHKTEETAEKVSKDGFADRGFSKEALIISTYFSTLSDSLIGLPLLFLFTNHEKEKVSDGPIYGSKIRNPGGAAPDFHNTYHIRVIKTDTFKSKLTPGFTMKLQTKKCSMGPDHRSILVDLTWRFVERGGALAQETLFDWDKATADLLSGDEVARGLVDPIVKVEKVTGAKYNCSALGLKEAPPSEVGAAIRANVEMMRQLRTALGIFSWRAIGAGAEPVAEVAPRKRGKKEEAAAPAVTGEEPK